jgi:hypothetical protein
MTISRSRKAASKILSSRASVPFKHHTDISAWAKRHHPASSFLFNTNSMEDVRCSYETIHVRMNGAVWMGLI